MNTSLASETTETSQRHLRFHEPHAHLSSAFGDDWFGVRAEGFARFFGTPTFLIGQTILVAIWITLNAAGLTRFDVFPFILLNLAFSLQAAYAAPLILLAQTRQSDRDKAHADADAKHREALAQAGVERPAARGDSVGADHRPGGAEHEPHPHHSGAEPGHQTAHRRDPPQSRRRVSRSSAPFYPQVSLALAFPELGPESCARRNLRRYLGATVRRSGHPRPATPNLSHHPGEHAPEKLPHHSTRT